MALTQRLEARLGQSLVMTPQLQQAIKLLQLSSADLAAYVEQELEKNPLLERDERAQKSRAEKSGVLPADAALNSDRPKSDADFPDDEAPPRAPQPAAPLIDWSRAGSGQKRLDAGELDFAGALARDVTLREHLTAQMQLALHDPASRMIAAHLIDMVDEAGYLAGSLAELSGRLGADQSRIESVLRVLQGFDPSGVCARNLGECLAIQLKEKDRLDPAMQALLDNLPLLARRDFGSLMKLCGVSAEDLADMAAEIRALNPKPGLKFGAEPVHPVVPDVYVREGADGLWQVELNTDTLPRVLVNERYYARVSPRAKSREEKTYLSECLASANWLVKSLDQRARTILKVASEIVRQQDAFLARGVAHLRPLNLRIVAEAIGMHESTVSRVTANKYMATPRGLFEMKYFFTSAIASTGGGEAHSAEAVRHRIRDLIARESEILSDDRLVEILREAGVDIARRTVAKYREAMRIPSSVERKRMKSSAARRLG